MSCRYCWREPVDGSHFCGRCGPQRRDDYPFTIEFEDGDRMEISRCYWCGQMGVYKIEDCTACGGTGESKTVFHLPRSYRIGGNLYRVTPERIEEFKKRHPLGSRTERERIELRRRKKEAALIRRVEENATNTQQDDQVSAKDN
jgi:hypothetical protein